MSISSEQVTHIARLARLKTTAEEAEFYAVQLNRILELVEQMNRIDTDGIEPMSHPQDVTLRLREDAATATVDRDAFQAIAPDTERGLYLVPRVVE